MTITYKVEKDYGDFKVVKVTKSADDMHEALNILEKQGLHRKDPKLYAELIAKFANGGTVQETLPNPHLLFYEDLDVKFLEPYIKGLKDLTGFDASGYTIDRAERAFEDSVKYILKAAITPVGLKMEVLSEVWKYEQDVPVKEQFIKEKKGIISLMEGIVGRRPLVPKYATGFENPADAVIGCPDLWNMIAAWWLKEHASEKQKAAAAEIVEISYDQWGGLLSYGGGLVYYVSSHLYLPDVKGTCAYGGRAPKVRVINDLKETSLEGWKPGNVLPKEENQDN